MLWEDLDVLFDLMLRVDWVTNFVERSQITINLNKGLKRLGPDSGDDKILLQPFEVLRGFEHARLHGFLEDTIRHLGPRLLSPFKSIDQVLHDAHQIIAKAGLALSESRRGDALSLALEGAKDLLAAHRQSYTAISVGPFKGATKEEASKMYWTAMLNCISQIVRSYNELDRPGCAYVWAGFGRSLTDSTHDWETWQSTFIFEQIIAAAHLDNVEKVKELCYEASSIDVDWDDSWEELFEKYVWNDEELSALICADDSH